MQAQLSDRAKKILDDLINAAIGAKTHSDMWWAQVHTAKLDRKHLKPMSAHSDFFRASQDAHYKAMFVDFALLFDKHSEASSIDAYLRAAQDLMPEDRLLQLQTEFKELRRKANPLIMVRHSTVAHINSGITEADFFKALGMTWNEIRGAINDAVAFIVRLADSIPGQVGMPSEGRMERATIRLLESIRL